MYLFSYFGDFFFGSVFGHLFRIPFSDTSFLLNLAVVDLRSVILFYRSLSLRHYCVYITSSLHLFLDRADGHCGSLSTMIYICIGGFVHAIEALKFFITQAMESVFYEKG